MNLQLYFRSKILDKFIEIALVFFGFSLNPTPVLLVNHHAFLNSLAPGRSGWNFICIILKHLLLMNIFSISLWNCPLVTAEGLHWWYVNIDSGNGFVPSEWLDTIRQLAITLTNTDQVLWCNMAAPGHNGFTHWGQEKNLCCFADVNLLHGLFRILIQIPMQFVSKCPIDTNSSLVQVMAWHQTCNNLHQWWPSSFTIYTYLSPGINELRTLSLEHGHWINLVLSLCS